MSPFNLETEIKPMWTRETAIEFLTNLETFLAANGYHCALGGSVMYRGTSDKDLDVIVYPHIREDCPAVFDLWRRLIAHITPAKDYLSKGSCRDGKDVRVMVLSGGRRIDFFFLK